MRQMGGSVFLIVFILILAGVFYAGITGSIALDVAFKPLIVISLLVWLFMNGAYNSKSASVAVGGLVLSLVGDVLLIFQARNGLFFIGGLISFLLAHILYIVYYLRSAGKEKTKVLKGSALIYTLILVYGVGFYCLLFNNLGDLKIPVVVYTLALVSMNIAAFSRYGKVDDSSFRQIVAGALLFTSSDSLLALNKFFIPLPMAGIWIMSTYAFAQYFIVKGIITYSQISNANTKI